MPGFRLIPPSLVASPQWERSAALDAAIDAATANGGIVGAVVLAARNGEIVYERAAGYADRESQRPVATQDRFRLASMTKAAYSEVSNALRTQKSSVTSSRVSNARRCPLWAT